MQLAYYVKACDVVMSTEHAAFALVILSAAALLPGAAASGSRADLGRCTLQLLDPSWRSFCACSTLFRNVQLCVACAGVMAVAIQDQLCDRAAGRGFQQEHRGDRLCWQRKCAHGGGCCCTRGYVSSLQPVVLAGAMRDALQMS